MPRNIEIKARARNWAAQIETAAAVASAREELCQHDTFFPCERGYLKLREFADGSAELIHYRRDRRAEPKASDYDICPVAEPGRMRDLLTRALGQGRSVRKRRTVLHDGQTRIHFDEVAGLGRFIELEVVLTAGQEDREGDRIAREWMDALGIGPDDLVEGTYAELLGPSSSDAPA